MTGEPLKRKNVRVGSPSNFFELLLLSAPKPHYASKQSGAQLHPPHGRGAAAQPRWSDRAQEAAAETAASSVRGHQQQKTTRQR